MGDPGLIPASGRSPGEGNSNPLQYSCLENPMTEEPGQLQSRGVTKSWTQLRDFTFTFTFQTPKLLWVERKLKNLLSCKYGLFLMWEKIGDYKVRIKISEDGAKSHKNHSQRPVWNLNQEMVLLCQAEFQNY